MSKLKIVAGVAAVVLMCNAGWQIGKYELASVELHDDMKDMASQIGARIGLLNAKSDDDFRKDILNKAKSYDIPLTADEITVRRDGEGMQASMYFAADYSVPINLPGGFSFQMHFNPDSNQTNF